MKAVAILGSARKHSNTLKALSQLSPVTTYDVIDLLDYKIHPYSYDAKKTDDDFLTIAQRIVESEVILFATPVYWYSMSGVMKDFFDRLTDLITKDKPIGRSLKGRKCYLIACGTESALPDGFEVPFRKTCEYFGMNFVQSFYTIIRDGQS